ncbi:MAG: FAD:protein FMN transferase [Lachnospiraceae bacterium]|nr:FAD:protein FMN transferase [Lachnospiraceae bacterium]
MRLKKNIPLILIILAVLAVIIIFSVKSQKKDSPLVKEGFYFDTYISITVYSPKYENQLNECMNMCERYENLFSRTVEGSDVYNINHSDGEYVDVDPETYYLISKAVEYCEETEGAADITVAPLMDIWGFSNKDADFVPVLPDDITLSVALNHVNYKNIILDTPNKVKLDDKYSAIDLGFIAKGYIADKLKEYLVSEGVESAIISLGGNINVIGLKPDGSEYNIGIKDPDNTGSIISSVSVNDKSVVTSGTYERYVLIDNLKYHHILDTHTGYPVNNNIKSVTVISDSSLDGDALSTICLILGEENSKEILNKHGASATFY